MSNIVNLTNSKVCASCKTDNPEVQRCSRCQHVYYCNVTCQKMDWPTHKLYCSRSGYENLDSARQSQIEASATERGRPFPKGKADEEDRFGKVAASPNSHNLSESSITCWSVSKVNLINILPLWINAERIVVLLSVQEQTNCRLVCKAFRQIVDDFFAIDHLLYEAKTTARSMEDPVWKAIALYEIVKIEIHKNLEAAKASARSIEGPDWKGFALREIVQIEAQKDLRGAKATAQSIEVPYVKAQAFVEIMKIEAQKDFKGAKAKTRSIKGPGWSTEAVLEIVKIEALMNLEGAKAMARSIKRPYWKVLALLEIAKVTLMKSRISLC
jgi:hypothetical protein